MTDSKKDLSGYHEADADLDLNIQAPVLRELLDYWQGLPHGDAFPGRADIVPSRIKQILPFLMLVDAVGPPPRFRWRLLGTAITQVMGRDNTGRWFDELYTPEVLARMIEIYSLAIERRCPVRYTGTFDLAGKDHISFESLHLPLADADGRIVMLMVGMVPIVRR